MRRAPCGLKRREAPLRDDVKGSGGGHHLRECAHDEQKTQHHFIWRNVRKGAHKGLGEALNDRLQMTFEDALEDRLLLEVEHPDDEARNHGAGFEDGTQEGVEEIFDGHGFAVCFGFEGGEKFEAAVVDRGGAAGNSGIEESFLGLEVVVDGGEVDGGSSGDHAEGSGVEAVIGEEEFGGIEDTVFGRG